LTIIEGFKDVGELAQTKPQQWSKIVGSALPAVDWLIKKHGFPRAEATAEQKKNLTREAIAFIFNMPDEIEKAHYIDKLSKIIGVPRISVERALEKTKSSGQSKKKYLSKPAEEAAPKDAVIDLEQQFISVVLLVPEIAQKVNLPDVELGDINYQKIYTKVKPCYNQPSKDTANTLHAVAGKLPRKMQELFAVNAVAWDKTARENESIAIAEFEALIKKILATKRESLKAKFAAMIAEAEKSGDIAKVKQLMQSLQQNL
jgi:DNA primase